MARVRRACWKAADAITAVSKADAKRIEAFTGRHCVVMPNGIDPSNYHYKAPSRAPATTCSSSA